jgi:hypothetical protein
MSRLSIAVLGLAIALAPAAAIPAGEGAASGESSQSVEHPEANAPAAVSAPPPLYRLPRVGKPRGRIGGGRRGPLHGVADLHALVPDHVGQTTSPQPSLYWYLAEPLEEDFVFELTLIDETSIDPVVDRRIERPAGAGLQRIRLADLGIALEPGQEYQWSVAAVPDPDDHSKDVVASGWIQRVTAPEGLEERLSAAGPDGAAAVYGEAGLWYDLLAALCERIGAHPEDAGYRQQLVALLEQVGLPTEAARRRP